MKVKVVANIKYGSGKYLHIGQVFDLSACEDKEVVAALKAFVDEGSRAVMVVGGDVPTSEHTTAQGVTAPVGGLGGHRLQEPDAGEGDNGDDDGNNDDANNGTPLKRKK